VKGIDRNRIDRLPTKGERWVGLILSAFLAFVMTPFSIMMFMDVPNAHQNHLATAVSATVFGVFGMLGTYCLFEFAFTKPEVPSARAQRNVARVGSVVSVIMIVGRAAHLPTTALWIVNGALLIAAFGGLLRARKKRTARHADKHRLSAQRGR